MKSDRPTTLQRIAPEIVANLADDVRVLNDRRSGDGPGGGDVDCVVQGLRPFWHLKLAEWRLCQAQRYDVTETCYVLVGPNETLALDVLDDPRGIGSYGFTNEIFGDDEEPGALAAAPVRAAYLTTKRIMKGQAAAPAWREIAQLAAVDWNRYAAFLRGAVGDRLTDEVLTETSDGALPPPEAVIRWQRAVARRRVRRPRALLSAGKSLVRVFRRIVEPTGLYVVIAGPDGVGKSSVADELPARCGQLFRQSTRAHVHPSLLPRPGALVGRPARDATQPHAQRPHGRVLSIALLAYHWFDALAGHAVRVLPARIRTTLVVVERGFTDIAVDPARYRLRVDPRLVLALARLLPGPDLVLVLDGDPATIYARKPELHVDEIARQSAAWKRVGGRGATVAEVDATLPFDEVLADTHGQIVAHLEARLASRLGGGWAAIPSASNPRLHAPRRPRALARTALQLELPTTTKAKMGLLVGRVVTRSGGLRAMPATAPPEFVRRALAPHLPVDCTFAVKRAVHPGRCTALIMRMSGEPVAIAKIASDDFGRARLRAEAAALEGKALLLRPPLAAPRVLANSEGVLVLEWIPHRWRREPWRLPSDVAFALGAFFAMGMGDDREGLRGPAHGDMTPWNLLARESGWAVIDWEVSLDDAPPFFDVFHYLVQSHAELGRPRRDELLRGIHDGSGWIGDAIRSYAAGSGVTSFLAPASFDRYLEHTSAPPTMRDMSEQARLLRRNLLSRGLA